MNITNYSDSDDIFEVGHFETEDEAAFAANVAILVLEGPQAKLNQGMHLTLERKKQIEREVLQLLKVHLKLPAEFKFGKFPGLYGEKRSGYAVIFEDGLPVVRPASEI
jgi:hypothetical protein